MSAFPSPALARPAARGGNCGEHARRRRPARTRRPSTAEVAGWFDRRWDLYASLTDRLWSPLAATAVELAGARPGMRVLDACAGAGAAALPLAGAVGRTGWVDAVDLGDGLVAELRRRAAVHDLDTQLHGHVADAGAWRGLSYDRVACVLGVQYLPDPGRLVSLLAPGGWAVFTVWAAGTPVRAAPEPVPGDPAGLCAWGESLGLRDREVAPARHVLDLDAPTVRALAAASDLLVPPGLASLELRTLTLAGRYEAPGWSNT